MSDTLGIGIVGYGKVACKTHRDWIAGRQDARLVAICDTTPARREAAQGENADATVYEDYDRFLSHSGLDLVVITTPPSSHCDLTIRACRAGKHVFVDKPFAMTLAQTREMLSAAEDAGVIAHCHQSRRYDPEYRAIARAVSAGMIGEVQHLRRIWSQSGDTWASWGIEGFEPTWRVQRSYGGGMVYDYAPHCGDQILRLVDRPLATVFADTRSVRYPDVDDHFTCMMRFAGGATAYLEASNNLLIPERHWYVVGTTGCLAAESVGGAVTLRAEGMDEPRTLEPVDERHELYDNVVASCRGREAPVVTPEQLEQSMGLIDAIFRSAAIGEGVNL